MKEGNKYMSHKIYSETKVTEFNKIPRYIGVSGVYSVDVPLVKLKHFIEDLSKDYKVELHPDFQRGYVWSEEQQVKYLEFILSGGISGNELYFNSPVFNSKEGIDIDSFTVICVDGLQRITAVYAFLDNKIKVFGSYYKEYTDKPRESETRFKVTINSLTRKKELYQWYIELNEGGTPHSQGELDRVREMLEEVRTK